MSIPSLESGRTYVSLLANSIPLPALRRISIRERIRFEVMPLDSTAKTPPVRWRRQEKNIVFASRKRRLN
jgi:hypothetical protein